MGTTAGTTTNRMNITILGWGSLIWDQRDLPISGDWQLGGPALPIEFSRISRDGRLTLVIDECNGVAVSTSYLPCLPTSNSSVALAQACFGAPSRCAATMAPRL